MHEPVVGRDDELVALLSVEVGERRAGGRRAGDRARVAGHQLGIVVDEHLLLVLTGQPVAAAAVRGDDDCGGAPSEALLVGPPVRRVDGRAGAVVGQRGGDASEVELAEHAVDGRVQTRVARGHVPHVGLRVERRLQSGRPLEPVVVRRCARRRDATRDRHRAAGAGRRTTAAT